MSRKLFIYKGQDLCFGLVPKSLNEFTKNYKQPIMLYDKKIIEERIDWVQSWSNLGKLHYAMKANFNLEILKIFKKKNCGLDVVSLGEIKQALLAGFEPNEIIFSGVGKSESELSWAIANEIYQINIESISELKKIINISTKLKKNVSIGIRINPEVDAQTHPSIATALKDSKFGLDLFVADEAIQLVSENKNIQLKALSFHLGSQIMNVKVFEKAIKVIKPYYLKTKKICPELDRLDLGGGLGIDYKNIDNEIDQNRWKSLADLFTKELKNFDAFIILEIGRFLVARSGVLISKVEVLKKTASKNFMVLDVGMSHLIRPALYQAYHEIFPMKLKAGSSKIYDVVGPICESTDVLMSNKNFPAISEGDFVVICDVGAYGSSMASRYNLRDEAIETFL